MAKPVPRKISFTVVGMQYRVTMSTREMLARRIDRTGPIACSLLREPGNEHDRNAVRVIVAEKPYKNLHLGYLSRQVAEIIAPALDGRKVAVGACVLREVKPRDGDGEILVTLKTSLKFPVNKLNSTG